MKDDSGAGDDAPKSKEELDSLKSDVDKKLTELEASLETKGYCTKEWVKQKDDERRQYVDDMVAKAKEESIEGQNELKQSFITQDAVNNQLNEKDEELHKYVDDKVAAGAG